jgi:hypothetical protein
MERKFSFIYSKIVEDQDDMIGHIAYSLYKARKIEYIEQFKEETGKTPSESDLESFHKSAAIMIDSLRIEAEQILSEFTQLTLDETVSEIKNELIENQETTFKEIIKPITPEKKGHWDGFWMSVLVKGTQTLVVAIIFFLIIFGYSAKNDFWGTMHKILPESNKVEHNNNDEHEGIKLIQSDTLGN